MFWPKLTPALLSLLLLCLGEVRGFGTGAPQSACQGMRPGPPHGENLARGTASPFILTAKKVRRRSKQVKGRRDLDRFEDNSNNLIKHLKRTRLLKLKVMNIVCVGGGTYADKH